MSMSPSGRARRRFLHTAGLATALTSTAALFPAVGPAAAQKASRSPHGCPDLKTPMKDVDGKVAFITGGSSGIGLGIARAFVAAGMKVAITYRTKGHIDEAMKYFEDAQDRVHAISVDVMDRPGMEKAAQETIDIFGKVHVLINNAGVAVAAPLSSTTYDDWDWVMGVNLTGVFNGVHIFLPRIQSHGEGGQIITTSSVLGLFVAGGLGGYSPTKFAVVGMMEALRSELADTNIGVSVYCPGAVIPNIMDASRSRPKNLGDSGFKPDAESIAKEKQARKDPKVQQAVLDAGQAVLRGMRNNDLYILTHSEFEAVIRDRNEALIASIPADGHPTEESLKWAQAEAKSSIYVTERDHQLCGKAGKARG